MREDPVAPCQSQDAVRVTFADEPRILPKVPVKDCLEQVKRLMRGDLYVARGCQQGLGRSLLCNAFGVLVCWGDLAVQQFTEELKANGELLFLVSGKRLFRRSFPHRRCRADIIGGLFPWAYDRYGPAAAPPSAEVWNYLAVLQMEPDEEEDSTADESPAPKGSGWIGRGSLTAIGSEYTMREVCDAQTLASPGRWLVEDSRFPGRAVFTEVADDFMSFA